MNARAAVLAFAALVAGCIESPALDPMGTQRRYGPYQASTFFDDGRAMRAPPPGTVAFGEADLSPDPPPLTPLLLARGRDRFQVFCATCHGLLGDGLSLVAQNMSLRPPPSLHDYRDRDPAYFHRVATEGYGLMPGYAAQMTDEERWAVAFYVVALQRSQWTPLEEAPPGIVERLRQEALP